MKLCHLLKKNDEKQNLHFRGSKETRKMFLKI